MEELVDTSEEWIITRTGIQKRHILKDPDKANSDMVVGAIQNLLSRKNIDVEEIDMIIVGTVTADYPFPDTANLVAHKIGAKNAFGYDINAACSGFIYSLVTASKFIETGTYKKILVVGSDQMSSIINYKDRTTCILFGDGAGVVLLEPNEEGPGVQDSILRAEGAGWEYLHMKGGGSKNPASAETIANDWHYVYQEGKTVFKAAVKGMSESIHDLLVRNNLTHEDIDWMVPHQANKRILSSVANYVGIDMDKVLINIEKYGNTTAGTIPLCLWDYESKFKKGDKIILTAFGGGFTWGSILLEWAY